ncbi:hypothetical protein [Variovorax sp. KK3]|uniref:hypothetical protein n=1 Tax=Variovorax sp. KK3 TaxID=1855728 RepID=UPI00097BCB30|nr:hypothetical protein [Variovorax sp. KK3]
MFRHTLTRSFAAALLLGAATLSSPTTWAQTAGSATQMQRERANCDGVQQDREACRREAGAARQEGQRGGLNPGAEAETNAMARCQLLQTPSDRTDCESRIRGAANSSSSGSVMGGGVIRETVTPVPAPAR